MESDDWKKILCPYLPEAIVKMLETLELRLPLEELRVRAGQPLQLVLTGGERLIRRESGAAAVSAEDCAEILRRVCEQSIYAWQEELKRGFITLPGGCRVGLCGTMSAAGGGFLDGDVTSFNFRFARAVPGAGDVLLPVLKKAGGRLYSTLILSAPGGGKTTMLRDLARQASAGAGGIRPMRVCVVDTRYELAGCTRGVPALDLGPRTDVLSGVPREGGLRMMIANMSPELLVTDELSTEAEAEAAIDARNCGITLLASAHADCAAALVARPAMRALLREHVFERYAFLSERRGRIAEVLDAALNRIECGEETVCSA